MRLGFIGTGHITSAMVTGLSSCVAPAHSICLSPRNATVAAQLAERLPGVSIASSNQDVLDSCDTVVIAVPPRVVQPVFLELRFRPDHRVISVVSSLSLQSVRKLVAPAAQVVRAVPLPSVAQRSGPTAFYPADPVVADLFASLGTAYAAKTENEFNAMCAVTATIASYFAFIETVASWLGRNGVSDAQARDYVPQIFWGAITVALRSPERSFQSIAGDHATAGGTNEQFLRYLVERGLPKNISEGLDAILQRINAGLQIV